ncbi:hypothetical protein FBEOM_9337 [Fusarium beomiforme]|uniref:Uncharacterized protein n=1 Tax=Fusarium beomiforme TaxID=44412 RepID=A0A9P5AEI8_9HYPO|nr:hypothetical protein FBEOM_9337 [Fusarium beomiforme]
MALNVTSDQGPSKFQEGLDENHAQTLDRAVRNVLQTEVAELTYAQILDGLPTEKSVNDSYPFIEDHPVYTSKHTDICPGFIDRAREFRAQFGLSLLKYDPETISKFQNTVTGSQEYNLRLIEMVVIACHQIGAYLFELDGGDHKHKKYQEWRSMVLEERRNGVEARRHYAPTPIAFSHRSYRSYEQYPRGFADVAGYWAESKIFGGVVVFDRGESETEVRLSFASCSGHCRER